MAIRPTALPIQNTADRGQAMASTQLQAAVGPGLKNPLMGGRIISGVALASGDNTISHGLGRVLQGWVPVRVRGAATLYDKQDSNGSPVQTLVINASAGVTVDLYVF